jgi:hypothetical protein
MADQPSTREITNLSGIDAPAAFIAIARHVLYLAQLRDLARWQAQHRAAVWSYGP